ncbi:MULTISPECIES: NAD(P)H-dependent oxidoreductase subunit E [Clostridium]|uniref:NADH dehydrogenase, 24 kDa subunit n=5 Tax=Clostridium TaxID=1485 RepID=D8GSX0_CLOLD|nr:MULTISPECIES: NAD(P)H-dependent oxidoreductase subunit E [Clostridium]ADK14540.1 NADH dehydrogenase, 24 kDa subunit [Clostridium ljungdahlii DSM 13528]AGY77774.1 NAD(P)H-dependent oxidoreductase subunit E [Clostridium autoethanogenum DSM 10061]ALU37909.1 NADH dehydrogenase subunit A [Clostridium autoethanogenum DSM 10061]AZV56451.1 NAD(P)H-dependent oxidoreductase subunit E [Clostridium sp. AWRP]OAA87022.1 NADP-reducing hydrogenase subunit HndA [Clostridium coskatii]
MDVCKLDNEKLKELSSYIDSLEEKEGSLISVLHRAQDIFGYLPEELQTFIANKLDISAAKVFGVVTFYSYFTMKPKGKHVISICMGTACFVKGAENILEEFRNQLKVKDGFTTEDGLFTIDILRCVGACGLAPVVVVDGTVHGKVKVEDVKGILSQYTLK